MKINTTLDSEFLWQNIITYHFNLQHNDLFAVDSWFWDHHPLLQPISTFSNRAPLALLVLQQISGGSAGRRNAAPSETDHVFATACGPFFPSNKTFYIPNVHGFLIVVWWDFDGFLLSDIPNFNILGSVLAQKQGPKWPRWVHGMRGIPRGTTNGSGAAFEELLTTLPGGFTWEISMEMSGNSNVFQDTSFWWWRLMDDQQ